MVCDTWVVTLVFFRDLLHLRPAGSYYRVCGFKCSKRDPAILGRGVLATIYMTATPNTIVLGIDPQSSRMLFHQLQRDQCAQNGPRARSPAVNFWLIAGVVVSATLVPCADMCLRGSPERRLVGLEMTSLIITVALVLFTIGFGRIPFIDLPLALAIMSFGGGLVFARFLEKHL